MNVTDLSALTTNELLTEHALRCAYRNNDDWQETNAELRRRLSAGEQAEREIDRWRDSVSDTAGIETPEQAKQYHIDREHDIQQAEARVAELKRENKSCSQRIERQRIRLAELEAIVANHREHYRAPIQKAADAARSHIVEWQEQYWRAQAAERERDRLLAELKRQQALWTIQSIIIRTFHKYVSHEALVEASRAVAEAVDRGEDIDPCESCNRLRAALEDMGLNSPQGRSPEWYVMRARRALSAGSETCAWCGGKGVLSSGAECGPCEGAGRFEPSAGSEGGEK